MVKVSQTNALETHKIKKSFFKGENSGTVHPLIRQHLKQSVFQMRAEVI